MASWSRLPTFSHQKVVLWTNFSFPTPKTYEDWFNFVGLEEKLDAFAVISPFAASKLPQHLREIATVIPHGFDPQIYFVDPKVPRKPQVVYSSSPDRGLQQLQRFDFEALGLTLKTTSYGGTSKVTDHEIAAILREATYWIHPGLGEELFCLSALEAQACGCLPVIAEVGALPTTCRSAFSSPKEGFLRSLPSMLQAEIPSPSTIASRVAHLTWDATIDYWRKL